jgi:hypothetical protein
MALYWVNCLNLIEVSNINKVTYFFLLDHKNEQFKIDRAIQYKQSYIASSILCNPIAQIHQLPPTIFVRQHSNLRTRHSSPNSSKTNHS